MKRNAIVRIVLYTVAILLLVGILTVALLADLFSIRSIFHSETENHLPIASDSRYAQNTVLAFKVESIDIEWAAGSITIEPVENTDLITVRETYDAEYEMKLYLDGNKLKIRFGQEDLNIVGFNTVTSKDLVITVPADWICSSLDIDAASAEVYVHDLTINEVDFDGASGECTLTNCTVNDLSLETVSGNVTFFGCVTDFKCEAVSADCNLELLCQARSITMETVSGDMKLVLPEACGFSCETETVSGSFMSEFDCTKHRNTYIHGDGACQIKLGGVSGSIQILKSTAENNCNH